MNQVTKTAAFVVAAIAAIGLAFATYPRPQVTVGSREGQPLFPELEQLEPKSLTQLKVVSINEAEATVDEFRVEQKDGLWVLPTHQDYPADATQHMATAATGIMGLKIEKEISDKPGTHQEFGVRDPASTDIKPGDTGIGKRITVAANSKSAADFIVGNSPENKDDYHYVRRADDNNVFLVKMNPDTWSTKFGDWIEKDLLKMDTFSIKQLALRDYSLEFADAGGGRMAMGLNQRGDAIIDFDDAKSEWKLFKYTGVDDQDKPVEKPLTDSEELNPAPLNDL